ncbi:hypothetical protein DMN91_012737, partial [Ooceraea biroi]
MPHKGTKKSLPFSVRRLSRKKTCMKRRQLMRAMELTSKDSRTAKPVGTRQQYLDDKMESKSSSAVKQGCLESASIIGISTSNLKLSDDDNTVVESDRLDTNCIQESTRAGGTVTPYEDDNDLVVESGGLDTGRIQENLPEGRRIVDISYMWNEIHRTFDKHARGIECQFKDWKLINSNRRGLRTQLFFKCQMCNYEDYIWSEPMEPHVLDVNTAAVAGTVTMGIGYAQLEEFCAA